MIADAFLPDTIENAMFEIVGVGNVPVFRKKWAEAFTLDGKSIVEHGFEKSGTVVLDEEHPEEVDKILIEGTSRAREVARETMVKVKKAMQLDYFGKE